METQNLDRIRFVTRHFHDLQGLRHWVPLGLLTLSAGIIASHLVSRLLAAPLFMGALVLGLGARRYYRRAYGEVERQPSPSATDLYPVPVFSPAGPAPRLEGFQPLPPAARSFLIPMGLIGVLFLVSLAVAPNIQVGSASWVTLDDVNVFGPRAGWEVLSYHARGWQPISYQAIFAQAACLLYGSFFLGVWIRRERSLSQRHYLALGALLMGLAALGAFLGYFVDEEAENAVRILNLVLPVVVRPSMALLVCGASTVVAGLLDHWQLVRALGWPREEE